MSGRSLFAVALALALGGCAMHSTFITGETAHEQVEATERDFARSMADRDLNAFSRFIAQEAVFFTDSGPLRGKEQVLQFWSRYFSEPKAPFSWEPDQVEVLASGTLAISSGPVRDETGKLIARFSSIWRQEQPGLWRIVFDKGSPASGE